LREFVDSGKYKKEQREVSNDSEYGKSEELNNSKEIKNIAK